MAEFSVRVISAFTGDHVATLLATPSQRVKELKITLERAACIPEQYQKLFLDGTRELWNHRTLSKEGLSAGAELALVNLPPPEDLSLVNVLAARQDGRFEAREIVILASYLLKFNSNPNEVSDTGDPVLQMAVCSDCCDSVSVLLEARADPNAAGRGGRAPLHTAVRHCKGMGIIKALLKARGDPNRKDDQGSTALFFARNRDVLDLLLEARANAMVMNHQGLTPLHIIISEENLGCKEDIVTQLLFSRACPNASKYGETWRNATDDRSSLQ